MRELLLALASAVASAASPGSPRAEPIAPLVTLVTTDDYPAEAVARGEEGSVRVVIRVDKYGAMSDCAVEESSGFASLDVQTCRIMWMRAKFKPAKDKHGNPVASQLRQQFVWRLEQGEPRPSEAWAMRKIISLAAGKAPECRYEFEGAIRTATGLPQCTSADSAEPAGKLPVSANGIIQFIEESKFAVDKQPTLNLAAADKLIGSQMVQVEVDASGNLTSCKIVESRGLIPPGLERMCATVGKEYKPRIGPKGTAAPFRAFFITGAYIHVEQVV